MTVTDHSFNMAGSGSPATRAGAPRFTESDFIRLSNHGEQLRIQFETQFGFDCIVDEMTRRVPALYVASSIDTYRKVIRANQWFFPTVAGELADVDRFFRIWVEVHAQYFRTATSIFEMLVTDDLSSLANPQLYATVIASETSRGWVGKRSPIGPDAQIESRAEQIEDALAPYLDIDAVDRVLDVGGALPGTPILRSAEEDMTHALTELAARTASGADSGEIRTRLLRDYCKYSEMDLESKVQAVAKRADIAPRNPATPTNIGEVLNDLPLKVHTEVSGLLDEIRALNFLNLNLEPRHSFKGWAGLMHGLVFAVVRDLPGMSDDIYHNLHNLKEKQ